MAKIKYDGVVEAVHYKPNGEVSWVRAYQRRGPTFSDHVLVKRDDLIQQIKSGKYYMVGQRVPLKASTFDINLPVKVIQSGGKDILVVGQNKSDVDQLDGVPII
jgi:hypothetical protein